MPIPMPSITMVSEQDRDPEQIEAPRRPCMIIKKISERHEGHEEIEEAGKHCRQMGKISLGK